MIADALDILEIEPGPPPPEVAKELQWFRNMLAGKSADELMVLALQSPAVHFATFVTIRDKDNREIRPEPNVLQLRMSKAYETLRQMGVKVRIVCVKPRRAGCSSFAAHIVYHHSQRFRSEGITISDIKAHSQELMEKVSGYSKVDRFPWGHRITGDTAYSLVWDNGSKWTVDTAENPNAGVGGTRHLGHFSEVAKWPQTTVKNSEKTMAAVLPSLSGKETVCIAESTPEGAQGWFYDTYCNAVTLDQFIEMHAKGICPEEQWVKVFAAWWEFTDNKRNEPVSAVEINHFKETLTDDEREGIELYGWSWEQIGWRRDTIRNVCNGDSRVFKFYYPSDDVSCWTASGSPRFDIPAILDMEAIAKRSTFDTGYLVTQPYKRVSFSPVHDGSGEIQIAEHPMDGLRYVVIGDPATGESQTIGADPDRNSVMVLRDGYHDRDMGIWRPAKQVARVKSPFYSDNDIMAGHMARLSKYYGNALVALEVNEGLGVLAYLKDAGVPLYKRKPESARLGTIVEQYGFKLSNDDQRRYIIDRLASAIRSHEIEVFSLETCKELKNFVVKSSGKAEAANGCHDDDVMCLAMGWTVLPSASTFRLIRRKEHDPKDMRSWQRVKHMADLF